MLNLDIDAISFDKGSDLQISRITYDTKNLFPKPLVNLKPAIYKKLPTFFSRNKKKNDESNQSNTESYIRDYFRDIPIMAKISKCESGFRQYNSDGSLLRNSEGSSAVGAMQIMVSVHNPVLKKLGYDVTRLKDNLAFARHLYNQSGTQPWNSSKHCWSKI